MKKTDSNADVRCEIIADLIESMRAAQRRAHQKTNHRVCVRVEKRPPQIGVWKGGI